MSQFGFFNVQQPQPLPARPAFDPYPARHPEFDDPRRFDDRFVRAPSPPRGGFFGAVRDVRPFPDDRMAQSAYESASMASMVPMNPMVGREPPMMARDPPYYPPAAPQPMERHFEMRDPYPPSASWRPEPPREERTNFFGSFSDTWRSATHPRASPPRDRIYNSAAFGSRRDISPEARRSFRDDRSPRRDDRARDRSRTDSWKTKDDKDRRRSDEKKSRWDRSGSRDKKKEEKDEEKTEKDRKSRDRDSKEPKEEEVRKENGEKKIHDDDKKEKENSVKKEVEEENVEPEAVEANDDNNDDIKDAEIIEEDEFEEGSNEYEEKGEPKSIGEEIEEPMSDESKKSDERDEAEKSDERNESEQSNHSDDRRSRKHSDDRRSRDRSNDRQSRIRSPSIDKYEKKREDSGFKILKDATFDEIHNYRYSRPSGRRPSFEKERERERERDRSDDYRSKHEPPRRHREDDWAVQYKAKVMMTKTAIHGLGGPTGPVAPPPVITPAIPRAPHVPYDAYATPHHALPRHVPAVPYPELIPPPRAAAYPPVAPPPLRRPLSPPVLSAYGLSVLARLGNNASQGPNWRAPDERDAYDRRRPQDDMRSRSPPPTRPQYSRSDDPHRERPGPVEYYTDRFRSDRPERAEGRGGGRYADRTLPSPSYEKLDNERERRHSHRSPPPPAERRMPPKQKPVVEEIDASKLVEPLEDDGWDDIARMLSPEKVVVEKRAKKPLLSGVPPPHAQQQQHHHRLPMPPQHRARDPLPSPPQAGGFFSSVVPSVKAKIAFPDSVPFYKLEDQHVDFFPAPGGATPRLAAPADDAYGRATSYEELASTNGAAAYRAGPAPGWERGGGRGY